MVGVTEAGGEPVAGLVGGGSGTGDCTVGSVFELAGCEGSSVVVGAEPDAWCAPDGEAAAIAVKPPVSASPPTSAHRVTSEIRSSPASRWDGPCGWRFLDGSGRGA